MDDMKIIYKRLTYALEEITDDKLDLFEELFYFIFVFISLFTSSPKLPSLLISVYNYYIDYLREINREHEIYETVIKFFQDLEQEKIKLVIQDEEFLESVINMLDEIEDNAEMAALNHALNYGRFLDLVESQSLSNSYYKLIKHKDILSEEKKEKYLSLITRR